MDHLPLLILGIFISTLGIVNIKGNISTMHSYNRRKVTEEDVPKYGRAVGTGTLVIGVSLVLSYLITFWNEAAIDYIVLPRPAHLIPCGWCAVSLFSISPAAFPAPHASRYTASPSAIPQYRNPFLTARCTVVACSGAHSITTPFSSCLAKQISRSVSADA